MRPLLRCVLLVSFFLSPLCRSPFGVCIVQTTCKTAHFHTQRNRSKKKQENQTQHKHGWARACAHWIAFSDVVFSHRFVRNSRDGKEFNLNVSQALFYARFHRYCQPNVYIVLLNLGYCFAFMTAVRIASNTISRVVALLRKFIVLENWLSWLQWRLLPALLDFAVLMSWCHLSSLILSCAHSLSSIFAVDKVFIAGEKYD